MTTCATPSPHIEPANLTLSTVQALVGRHIPFYRVHTPTYQLVLLQSLRELWNPAHARLLDVVGGTGIIAQAMKDLFGIPHVTSVDVKNRFLKTLDVETRTCDGLTLPFADASFDSITLSNVIHHVPVANRSGLIRECRRVANHGPVYIKDHVASSRLDHARLFILDAVGNVPFGGMVRARYLTLADWERLATDGGYRIDASTGGRYRSGLYERAFPNRLELTMRLVPAV